MWTAAICPFEYAAFLRMLLGKLTTTVIGPDGVGVRMWRPEAECTFDAETFGKADDEDGGGGSGGNPSSPSAASASASAKGPASASAKGPASERSVCRAARGKGREQSSGQSGGQSDGQSDAHGGGERGRPYARARWE